LPYRCLRPLTTGHVVLIRDQDVAGQNQFIDAAKLMPMFWVLITATVGNGRVTLPMPM
jgi:hypothetical protein